jgi:septum formation inhibitor MinC
MKIAPEGLVLIKCLASDARTVAKFILDGDNVKNPPNAAFYLGQILKDFRNPEYVKQLNTLLATLESGKNTQARAETGSVTVHGSISPGSVIVTGNGNVL